MIALTPINHSSQIAAHGYHSESQTLVVRFKKGGTWHYRPVPPKAAEDFANAKSMGSHLHTHIKSKFKGELQPTEKKHDPQ